MSPVATPTTRPSSISSSAAAKARVDLDSQRLGLGAEPAADVAEGDDEVAVVVHLRRASAGGSPPRAVRYMNRSSVARGGQRAPQRLPVRQQLVERARSRSRRRTGCARRPRRPSRPRRPRASGASCFSRIAAASPAGPAPTITTSNSIASRAASSDIPVSPICVPQVRDEPAVAQSSAVGTMRRWMPAWTLLAALRLQLEWGADEALADRPVDRLGQPVPAASVAAPRGQRLAPSPALSLPAAPPVAAGRGRRRRRRRRCDALRRALAGFDGCALRPPRPPAWCFADGNPAAGLMLVGDVPWRRGGPGREALRGTRGAVPRSDAGEHRPRPDLLSDDERDPLAAAGEPGAVGRRGADLPPLPAAPDCAGAATAVGATRRVAGEASHREQCWYSQAAWPMGRVGHSRAARSGNDALPVPPRACAANPRCQAGCMGRPAAAAAKPRRRCVISRVDRQSSVYGACFNF